ncbi:MAG: fumarylacetoacetate hydrolase family protein [Bacteroidetes bacterium]|nr:fumarylacetoacetate hydrolase family protein [Bacteroidota bacterium]
MKLVTYVTRGGSAAAGRPGAIVGDRIVDLQDAMNIASVLELLQHGEGGMSQARSVVEAAATDAGMRGRGALLSEVVLLAPIPRPTSMRDGYAFRQHVEAARRNRGVEMIPEFDLFPIFYFTNHQAVTGPGDVAVQDLHLNRLDFELECAIVIGREGRNIKASEADDYIAGYTVMNDWSARALQMEEMKLNLGPAKGKDFATSIGPYLATRDELAAQRIPGENGERYDLTMVTRVNGTEVSRGNLRDMTWTFAQILERASYGVTLYPGDVIGSGTVGTGCFLELNGSKITDNWWLKDGDVVECEIDLLGTLRNTVKRVGP